MTIHRRNDTDAARTTSEGLAPTPKLGARVAYQSPRLERLGAWSAVTLQQSIPIFNVG